MRVDRLFHTLTLPNVHHLVSTISGTLRPYLDAIDALSAALPCGSITGAPKVQEMKIISALEPVGRSVYCGAIGYVDAGGDVDLGIAIRTLVLDAAAVHCWGGSGIVDDSDCDAERREIDHKIGRLLDGVA